MSPTEIKFSCPHCQQHLEAPSDMSGEPTECPTCRKQIIIPLPFPTQTLSNRMGSHSADQHSLENMDQGKSSKSFSGRIVGAIVAAIIILVVMNILLPVLFKTVISTNRSGTRPDSFSTINSDENEAIAIGGPLLKKSTAISLAIAQDYKAELDAIDLSTLLNGEELKRDADYRISKEKIVKANAALDKYRKDFTEWVRTARLEIATLPISESKKKKALEGFDNAFADKIPIMDAAWSLEKQSFDELENVILCLADSKGWQAEGRQILFNDDADLAKFNSILQHLQKVASQQEQTKSTYRTQTQRGF